MPYPCGVPNLCTVSIPLESLCVSIGWLATYLHVYLVMIQLGQWLEIGRHYLVIACPNTNTISDI